MGKFSPTKLHGECEEIANPSTAYGRRRRNWTDAHGSVPAGQVVDASCGNKHCIALQHAYLRPPVEPPRKHGKTAKRGPPAESRPKAQVSLNAQNQAGL